MPLLKREPEIFPEGLMDLPGTGFPWSVAHTRSRQEKALARHLVPLGIPFYLPQGEKRTERGGRTFVSHIPLFPGYVFLRGAAAERAAVLRSNLVVRFLEVADQELLGAELRELLSLQRAGASLFPVARRVSPGDVVRITEGPFRGYMGMVERELGRRRLIVTISILRQSVAVEFGRAGVSPVSCIGNERSAVA